MSKTISRMNMLIDTKEQKFQENNITHLKDNDDLQVKIAHRKKQIRIQFILGKTVEATQLEINQIIVKNGIKM